MDIFHKQLSQKHSIHHSVLSKMRQTLSNFRNLVEWINVYYPTFITLEIYQRRQLRKKSLQKTALKLNVKAQAESRRKLSKRVIIFLKPAHAHLKPTQRPKHVLIIHIRLF